MNHDCAPCAKFLKGIVLIASLALSTPSAWSVVLPVSTRTGIGAIPYQVGTAKGITFRTWAPNAQAVSVALNTTFYNTTAYQLTSEGNGYWSGDIANLAMTVQYKFAIKINGVYQLKIDPRARQVTNSVGTGVLYDPNSYVWTNTHFQIANWNELVIYEMHVGAFYVPTGTTAPANFQEATLKLDHLKNLGINCISLLPVGEFPGDISWGYNPSFPFAVESAYGGANELKKFVDACHTHGIAVLNDVVFNHLGPNDLSMWQYDGWSQNNLGGIYFYNDTTRATTPWGNTRMDYSRNEVRQYIRDNAMMWLDEFKMDGLRWDGTKYMRRTDQFGVDIPEAWSLLQWCNNEIDAQFPEKISIAEDFDDNDWIGKPTGAGGAGFDSQWDWFVHSVRGVIEATSDSSRDMPTIQTAIEHSYNGNHTQRVIYTESHDEVANGKMRVPSSISVNTPGDLYARKRSTLGAGVMFFSPGIPMMFMGQEFLEDGFFDANDPLDWSKTTTYAGILAEYTDMIALRRNTAGLTKGLTGANTNVHHLNNWNKVIAWHRYMNGGAGDDVVVIANFSVWPQTNYRVGMPRSGTWHCRFAGDATAYGSDYANVFSGNVQADGYAYDGLAQSGVFNLGAYSIAVYSQGDATPSNPADLDGSCVVDGGDVALLLLDIGSLGGPADLDGDGIVTLSDLAFMLLDYGWTCN